MLICQVKSVCDLSIHLTMSRWWRLPSRKSSTHVNTSFVEFTTFAGLSWTGCRSTARSNLHLILTQLLQLAVSSSVMVNHSASAVCNQRSSLRDHYLSVCNHVKPALKQLHWLPVQHRIHYKLCLLYLPSLQLATDTRGHSGVCTVKN